MLKKLTGCEKETTPVTFCLPRPGVLGLGLSMQRATIGTAVPSFVVRTKCQIPCKLVNKVLNVTNKISMVINTNNDKNIGRHCSLSFSFQPIILFLNPVSSAGRSFGDAPVRPCVCVSVCLYVHNISLKLLALLSKQYKHMIFY